MANQVDRRMFPRAAADYLGISHRTLANWRCGYGEGPPYIKVGGKVVYLKSDLDAWISERRRTSTTTPVQAVML